MTLLVFCGTSLMVTSCKDADNVKDLKLDQVLSATGLTMVANADLSITVSWSQMFNADQYELIVSQDENFSDASKVAFSDVIAQSYTKGDYCSVIIPKLDPETKYFARVQAIASDGSSTASKYVYGNVTTVAEQIMKIVDKGQLTATSATIEWTAGEFVKAVEIRDAAGDLISTLTPTSDENTAGKMVVDGLNPHTSYTIRLVSATDKTRGSRVFTTLLDLSNAITISAGDADWVAKIEGATSGSVFALEAGDYKSEETVDIASDVVIAAADITNMPTLHCQFSIDKNAALYCYYLAITADDAKLFTDQCFNFKSTGQTSSLDVEGCEIYNFVKGLVYINTSTVVNEINITGCYIHNIVCTGGDFIDSRSGSWNTLNFKDNTVVNCFVGRDFLRSPNSSVATGLSNVVNNTFYKCGNGEANYRLFYTQIKGAVNNFNKNVVAGFNNKRGFCNGSITVVAADNVYYDCLNLTEIAEGNTEKPTFFDENGQVLTSSPFKDEKNNVFYLTDANLRLKQVGASKWYE